MFHRRVPEKRSLGLSRTALRVPHGLPARKEPAHALDVGLKIAPSIEAEKPVAA